MKPSAKPTAVNEALNISEKSHSPQLLYQLLRDKVFSQPQQDGAGLATRALEPQVGNCARWRERLQLSPALAVAQLLEQHRSLLVVMPNSEDIGELASDLAALGLEALIFPSWGSSLYKGIRSQNRVFTERSSVLAQIHFWQRAEQRQAQPPLLVLCSLRALGDVLPPPEIFSQSILRLQAGSAMQPTQLAELLSSYGYYQVPRVSLPGEYALRGEVLDFLPPGQDEAVRVRFGFDEIEMLKIFDTSSQISRRGIPEFSVFPLREVLWQESEQKQLRRQLEQLLLEARPEDLGYSEMPENWDELWGRQQSEIDELLDKLARQQEIRAEELLFPLVWDQPANLLDYMRGGSHAETLVLFWGYQRIERQEAAFLQELEALYQQSLQAFRPEKNVTGKRLNENLLPEIVQRKLMHPQRFAVNLARIQSRCRAAVITDEFEGQPWPLDIEATLQYQGNLNRFSEDLGRWLEQGYQVAIGCSSTAQAQRLRHILKDFIRNYGERLQFFDGELSRGALFPRQKLALLQEWQILGTGRSGRGAANVGKRRDKEERIAQRLSQSEIISSFVELKEGDLVVHVQHGVGRFKGIERIGTSRVERDYLAIEYSDDNTLFVPIEQVNMVQRYIGSGSANLRLDRIGGKAWQERKDKTQKAVEDLADRLLRLYTRRAASDGFCCPPDDDLMEEFEADFPYEPTADQLRAVAEIKGDLQNPKPMDRLLCGDVGFGKTEVAMRASFKIASNGRQVLVLCPTTILAEQHYHNFCKRFARFPLRIGMLSRFVERKRQQAVMSSLEKGEVDILIGTHRILAKDIHLRNLGLIVIDEEQRFGVKHKERLKLLKTSVDCLSMSATPIPRTLHMSLVQIRDISMLTTPPRNRHPVETFVREFNPQSIASAIRQELSRSGQVFYLHNRVESLEEILLFLRELVPEALIEMAHGQMDSKELEDIMYRFVHGGFNVLLATSIIENGIDIPNVNTIIIDRADRYGIGQLYQLRGRVGRSDQLAYAYLFYPDRSGLSDLALKRLKIISDFTELGSGFKVAMKDLEVRGAGNLLGPEQSGNIISVGFEMYTSMLAKAMSERRYQLDQQNGETSRRPANSGSAALAAEPELAEEISLELDYSGYIPDSYIADATEKIDLYKRISSIDRTEMLSDFYEELFDRFGPPPDEVHSLLSLAELRVTCRQLGINFLKERQNHVELRFSKARSLPLEKIMRQIQRYPKIFHINPKQSDSLLLDLGAYLELEEALAQQREAAAKRQPGSGGKKNGKKKTSRNADYLQREPLDSVAQIDQAEQMQKSDNNQALRQKTGALHKLLSSLQ